MKSQTVRQTRRRYSTSARELRVSVGCQNRRFDFRFVPSTMAARRRSSPTNRPASTTTRRIDIAETSLETFVSSKSDPERCYFRRVSDSFSVRKCRCLGIKRRCSRRQQHMPVWRRRCTDPVEILHVTPIRGAFLLLVVIRCSFQLSTNITKLYKNYQRNKATTLFDSRSLIVV